jgi:hypothetical protein
MAEKTMEVGVEVWLDAFDLPGGAPILSQVKEAIRISDECLILLSPASVNSDWVRHEAGLADAHDKWISLIVLHNRSEGVPVPLKERKFMFMNEFSEYLTQLRKRATITNRRGS